MSAAPLLFEIFLIKWTELSPVGMGKSSHQMIGWMDEWSSMANQSIPAKCGQNAMLN